MLTVLFLIATTCRDNKLTTDRCIAGPVEGIFFKCCQNLPSEKNKNQSNKIKSSSSEPEIKHIDPKENKGNDNSIFS